MTDLIMFILVILSALMFAYFFYRLYVVNQAYKQTDAYRKKQAEFTLQKPKTGEDIPHPFEVEDNVELDAFELRNPGSLSSDANTE